jgi:hypothetical protein
MWHVSAKTKELMVDWELAEINILAGLENRQRTVSLAKRLQQQFVADLKGDINDEFRTRYQHLQDSA